ncbi:MAG: DUF2007 domain-containing protein [Pseudomonadota bacterium]
MEEILRTNDPVKLSYARHVLGEAGIASYVLDEHTAYIDGRGPLVPIRLMVASDDAAQARIALNDLERE